MGWLASGMIGHCAKRPVGWLSPIRLSYRHSPRGASAWHSPYMHSSPRGECIYEPPSRRRRRRARAPRRLRGPPSKASTYSRPARLSKRHSVYLVLLHYECIRFWHVPSQVQLRYSYCEAGKGIATQAMIHCPHRFTILGWEKEGRLMINASPSTLSSAHSKRA